MTLQRDIADFLVRAFGGNRDLARQAYITSFPNDPGGDADPDTRARMWAGGPAEVYLPKVRATHNIYLCISIFKPGLDAKVHRRRANFQSMHFIMVDDVGDGPSAKIPFDRIPATLPPTWAVETSPRNWQLWYAYEPAILDSEMGERIVDLMIKRGLLADDPGMRGVTRFGRLPFGVNTKAKYKIAGQSNGFRVTSNQGWRRDFVDDL